MVQNRNTPRRPIRERIRVISKEELVMKSYGDIPLAHRLILEDLVEMESWLTTYGDEIPMLTAAQGRVCLAYDYYCIEMEEEGDRLITSAEKVCPSYFKGAIQAHMNSDGEFRRLVELLKNTPGADLMKSLGFSM